MLPLTTLESGTASLPSGSLTWDFAPGSYDDGSPRQWGALVTDDYTLTNPTGSDISVTALYPVTGSLADLGAMTPEVTVNGSAAEVTLYAGGYTGDLRRRK